MTRTAGIIPALVGALTLSCGKDESRPLLSGEERRRHNAPLAGEPCAILDTGLLSGSVVLGGESYPGTLRTHVDDCGNLVAAWYDNLLGGLAVVRVLRNGDLDWKAPFPNDFEGGLDAGLGVNDIASDHAGSLFLATQHALLGFTAAGDRHPISPALPGNNWQFIKRIEDVRGEDAPTTGIFVAGSSWYQELSLPNGYVIFGGSGGPSDGGTGRFQSAPLSSSGSPYFPDAEVVHAQVVSVPQGGLEAPLARLTVERVRVSFDEYQSPERTVVFHQDSDQGPRWFSLASRGGEYAIAVTSRLDDGEISDCRGAMHWISKGASFEMEGCANVVDSLFTQDGSYWSLWADREETLALRFFRWGPSATFPEEVVLEISDIWTHPESGNVSASLAKTSRGTVVVTTISSNRNELRFIEIDAAE